MLACWPYYWLAATSRASRSIGHGILARLSWVCQVCGMLVELSRHVHECIKGLSWHVNSSVEAWLVVTFLGILTDRLESLIPAAPSFFTWPFTEYRSPGCSSRPRPPLSIICASATSSTTLFIRTTLFWEMPTTWFFYGNKNYTCTHFYMLFVHSTNVISCAIFFNRK